MTDFDYQNWLKERDLLIDDVLNIFREQQDARARPTFSGSVNINPRDFKQGKHIIVGPIDIGTTYSKEPVVTFGQQGRIIGPDTRVTNLPSQYSPFLVMPYVYKWKLDNSGIIDGFYIGVLLINEPNEYVEKHTIHWTVVGEASRYIEELSQENWTEPYYEEDLGFLVENPSHPEDSGY